MNNQDQTYYLIDQYLKGELPSEEVHQFEKKLIEDSSFAEAFEEQKMLNDVILGASIADLRRQMQADINTIDQKPKSHSKGYYILGLGLISALSLGYIFWPTEKKEQFTENKNVHKTETSTLEKDITTDNTSPSTSPVPHISREKQPEQDEVVEMEVTSTNKEASASPVNVDTLSTVNVPTGTKETPDENIEFTTPEDICKRTQMQLDVSIQKACVSENNGAIIIKEITGGEAPYTLFDKNSSAIIKDETYSQLRAGKYDLYVVDANSCIHEFSYYVPSKNCSGESIVIDINANQGWKIPSQETKITIFNAGGTIVFEKPANTVLKEWMGLDKNGQPLAAGVYIYKMEYQDGKIITGQINVMQ